MTESEESQITNQPIITSILSMADIDKIYEIIHDPSTDNKLKN